MKLKTKLKMTLKMMLKMNSNWMPVSVRSTSLLVVLPVVLLALALTASLGFTPPAERAPNIVLIVADDLGYGDLGAHGSQAGATPRIDSLAAAGVQFKQAYATAASCTPSRAALLTGTYQHRFGVEFNAGPPGMAHDGDWGLPSESITLAERLRDAGYVTGMIGKWHLGTQDQFHPLEHGFDEFFGFLAGWHSYHAVDHRSEPPYRALFSGRAPLMEAAYLTQALSRESVSFIERHRDEPFLLVASFNAPHHPYETPPQVYVDRFADVALTARRNYLAMLSALDDAVGEIVDALDRHDLTDDTILVFTSDHGSGYYMSTNEPLRLGKGYLFDGGVRVPLILRWPGVATPGTSFYSPVSLMDIAGTAYAASRPSDVEVEEPGEADALDGIDLAPMLREGRIRYTGRSLFWRNATNFAVRSGRWKLVQAGDHPWLFDLKNDEGELWNLASEQPEVVEQLRDEYEAWSSELPAPLWVKEPGPVETLVDGVPYELIP